MKTQTKALIASLIVVALGLSAVSGVTYSWWSDMEQTEISVTTGYVDVTTSGFSITKGGHSVDEISNNSSIPRMMGITYNPDNSTGFSEWDPNSSTLKVKGDPNDEIIISYTVTFSWTVAAKYMMDFGTGSQRLDVSMVITDVSSSSAEPVSRGIWIYPGENQTSASYNVELVIDGLGMNLNDSLTITNDIAQAAYGVDIWDGTADSSLFADMSQAIFTIETAEQLAGFADMVNERKQMFSGKTVILANDIDLKNLSWNPIGQTGAYNTTNGRFAGTFDGGNHTITNLNVDVWKSGSDGGATFASGLFGWANEASAIIKNLTIDGAEIVGHHYTGVICGYMTGTVSNCVVKNATVSCTHINDHACGDKAGGMVGFLNVSSEMVGCSVSDTVVKAGRDAGQLIGAICSSASQESNTASNVSVSVAEGCTDENSGSNISNRLVGRTI